MLCRIPFTYVTASILKGHRKLEPHVFGAWTEVEIPEVSSADAPVAFSWTVPGTGGGEERHETRWFDGTNWSLASRDNGRMERERFLAGDFAHLAELEHRHFRNRRSLSRSGVLADILGQDRIELLYFVIGAAGMREMDPVEIRELAWSGRDETEARVQEACESLLFVDGELWVRGGEPFYSVCHPGYGWATNSAAPVVVPEMTLRSDGHYHLDPSVFWNRFRADRLDDALDFASSVCPRGDDVRLMGRIETSIPQAIQFDDEGDCLRRAAREAVELGHRYLMHQDRRSVEAWLNLRDLSAGGSEASDIAEGLKRFGETLCEDNEAAVIARHALARWDLRPVPLSRFEF